MFISTGGAGLSMERAAAALSAVGEHTRLRALALLAKGEMAVGELASALGQSQPRVSRHLKLMTDAGLIQRLPEGAWVFYRLAPSHTPERVMVDAALASLDPREPTLVRDAERLADIRAARDATAAAYFARNAADWDRVRALHLPDADIEAAMLKAAGQGPFDLMVDVGVGAGRMIELFADRVRRAEGFDTSRQMLAVARAKLCDLPEGKAAVRIGDAYDPPTAAGSADLVTMHQVLHFLAEPGRAIAEAARLLRPGGRLVIADFAPHDLEFLRDEHAHRRLGFSESEIKAWCAAAGVEGVATVTLTPKGVAKNQLENKLIVKIWAGNRAKSVAAQPAGIQSAEVAA